MYYYISAVLQQTRFHGAYPPASSYSLAKRLEQFAASRRVGTGEIYVADTENRDSRGAICSRAKTPIRFNDGIFTAAIASGRPSLAAHSREDIFFTARDVAKKGNWSPSVDVTVVLREDRRFCKNRLAFERSPCPRGTRWLRLREYAGENLIACMNPLR